MVDYSSERRHTERFGIIDVRGKGVYIAWRGNREDKGVEWKFTYFG